MSDAQLSDPLACLWPGTNNYPGIAYPNSIATVAGALNSYSAAHPNGLIWPRILRGPRA